MTKTQRFRLAATSLGLFMIYLDALIVKVALPEREARTLESEETARENPLL